MSKGGREVTVAEVKHQGKLREWQERIMECRSSGKAVKTWCLEQGVSVTTYYRWEREIIGRASRGKEGSSSMAVRAPEFAEVPAVQAAQTRGAQPMIRVHTGGMAVEIYCDADREIIQTVIEALRSC